MHTHHTALMPDAPCAVPTCPQYASPTHNHAPPYRLDGSTCPSDCPFAATGAPPSPSDVAAAIGARIGALAAEEAQRNRMADALESWWIDRSHAEIMGVVPKAIEYSATDLVDIGRQLAQFGGWTPEQLQDEAALAELGIVFYIHGKLGRVMGALKEGRRPSDDTWHDIAVYTKMAQRVREVGSWPGV